jgi:folate-binding protein YgfZ
MTLCRYNSRSLIALSGADAAHVLQGLITQDVHALEKSPLIYTAWLNAQGRYLFDFFLFLIGDTYYALIESGRSAEFIKMLSLYKLRNHVDIQDLSSSFSVLIDTVHNSPDCPLDTFFKAPDPRHPSLGTIIVVPEKISVQNLHDEIHFQNHRYVLGITEGSQELSVQKSVILEYHFDAMTALSWTKGCYMGQELMARTKHRGGIHKECMGFTFNAPPQETGTALYITETKIGALLCHTQTHGLGLVRHEYKDLLQANQFHVQDDKGNGLQLIPSPLSHFFK